MNTKLKIINGLISISIAVLFSNVALADDNSTDSTERHNVAEHLHNQKDRIKQGVKSGQLTKHETKHLVAQQRHTRRDVKRARADGRITKGERRHLSRDIKRSNRAIYKAKHNGKTRRH